MHTITFSDQTITISEPAMDLFVDLLNLPILPKVDYINDPVEMDELQVLGLIETEDNDDLLLTLDGDDLREHLIATSGRREAFKLNYYDGE